MWVIVVLFITLANQAINLLKNSVLEDRWYIYKKNIVFVFSLFQTVFLFSIYKMVDIMDIYKPLNIRIGTVMKNSEILKFFPDHLKTKIMCKHAAKNLPYLLRYVSDQYKTHQMRNKAIPENGGTLKSFPDCYRNQETCNKAVDNYTHVVEFVPECYETHKMCDKAFFYSTISY